MKELWKKIEEWLLSHMPEMHEALRGGLAEESVILAETALGVTLPPDVRLSYRIHDGQATQSNPVFGEWHLFPLQKVVGEYQIMKQLHGSGKLQVDPGTVRVSGPVKPEWWNPKWIGFAANDSGDMLCLDFDPEAGGREGQVITFWHLTPRREVVAGSFREWLQRFVDGLDEECPTVIGDLIRKT